MQSEQARSYYSHPQVRARMLEYIGRARYICSHSPGEGEKFQPKPPDHLGELLAEGGEIHRSLWDDSGLLVVLDLEYVRFDDPVKTYEDPRRGFEVQVPIVDQLQGLLQKYELPYRHLVTGRGHHFSFLVGRHGPAFEILSRRGELSPALLAQYDTPHRPLGKRVSRVKASAFSGMGMVLEYLGHQLLERCRISPVPLRLAALEPATAGEREIVCLDLSAFGDPLHRRSQRLPFSLYKKGEVLGYSQPIVCLPQAGLDLRGILELRKNLPACAAWAQQSDVRIPLADRAVATLFNDYQESKLARFHEDFYRNREPQRHFPLTSLNTLPHCIQSSLTQPNDLLLKPAALQNLVRCLLASGWKSSQVARLVSSRLEQDHGWLPGIHFHEGGCRADFYTRLFGGLLESGHDRLEDLDCESTRRKGFCTRGNCGANLARVAARWLRGHRYD